MAKQVDIEWAFRKSIRVCRSGKRTVETADFIAELARYNWNWGLKEANHWIEIHYSSFKDISSEEGERRTFMLYNRDLRF